jgi:hypothetical protein
MTVVVAMTVASGAHAQPVASATPPSAPEVGPAMAAELARLEGQRVRVLDEDTTHGRGYVPRYIIDDVAGEGAPVVGVVERRGQALWLVAEDGASYRLAGALARPRIAGPGYKIWALGAVTAGSGEHVLVARRIGILAPPWQRAQARGARKTIFAISAGAPTRTGGPQ